LSFRTSAAYFFFPRLLDFPLELRLVLLLDVDFPRDGLVRDGELADRLEPLEPELRPVDREPEDRPEAGLRVVERGLDVRLGLGLGPVERRWLPPAEVELLVVERVARVGEIVRLCERRALVFGRWDRLSSRFLSFVPDPESRDLDGAVRWSPADRGFVRGRVLDCERCAESSRVVRRGWSGRGFESVCRRSGAGLPSRVERGLAALR
jgi:hypothetical protein